MKSRAPVPILSPALRATVVRVKDGDTAVFRVTLRFHSYTQVPIRLVGVKAPEDDVAAKKKLQELLPVGAEVIIAPEVTKRGEEKMTFERYLARVWRDGIDVCEQMQSYLNHEHEAAAAHSHHP
jgi:endonuclease YncB( thermonuclease family)